MARAALSFLTSCEVVGKLFHVVGKWEEAPSPKRSLKVYKYVSRLFKLEFMYPAILVLDCYRLCAVVVCPVKALCPLAAMSY